MAISSSTALRCPRLFLNGSANAEKDSNKLNLKPLLGRRKIQMLRSFACANLPMKSRSGGTLKTNAVTTTTPTTTADPFHCNNQKEASQTRRSSKEEEEEPVLANKLDEWMRDSVTEIVRNIGEAPFLVHIYSNEDDDDGSSSFKTMTKTTRRARLEREPAVSEDWLRISRKWKINGSSKPDGVILVGQLKANDEEKQEEEDGRRLKEYCSQCQCQCQCSCRSSSSSSSSSWGIVIQGRGLDRPACYILKTSRVCSSVGFCTHFCLVRAKCFGGPPELQLRDSWLQRQ